MLRAAPHRAEAGIFLVDVQEPFHKIERITVLANCLAKLNATCTLTTKIIIYTSRLHSITFNRNIETKRLDIYYMEY